MKRVLIVGADFAPSSYPPSLRIRFFAHHLPAYGWRPTVVTIRGRDYEWKVDPEIEKLVRGDLEIVRSPAWPAGLTRKLGIGDLGLRSLWNHWREIRRQCARRRFDLVFIPIPPFFSAVLGRWAWRRFHIPYVIDYIDPWVSDYWKGEPNARRLSKRGFMDWLSRLAEPYALRHASHLVGVSKGTTDDVIRRCNWLGEVQTTEIPYGGEAADFDYLREHPRKNPIFRRGDGLFHVSYVGRGGHDVLPALRALFEAVKLAVAQTPELAARLRLHFVGTTYAHNAAGQYQVLPLAQEVGVAQLVEEHPGRVSYLDALQILLDSDALVAVGSHAPHYTASKIFPYILARRPLLAIYHEASTVVRILRETQCGRLVTFNSQTPPTTRLSEIAAQLRALLEGSAPNQPTNWAAFEPYTTRALTGKLAAVFDNVIARNAKPAAT